MVLAATATRLPIVLTDVGDVRRLVAAEDASLVTRDELVGHLSHLIANRAKAERDFDQAGMFAAWQALLEDDDQPRGTHSGL